MLECFRGQAYELNVVRREKHPDAEGRTSPTLADGRNGDQGDQGERRVPNNL
jgi:hypothetical protein